MKLSVAAVVIVAAALMMDYSLARPRALKPSFRSRDHRQDARPLVLRPARPCRRR